MERGEFMSGGDTPCLAVERINADGDQVTTNACMTKYLPRVESTSNSDMFAGETNENNQS